MSRKPLVTVLMAVHNDVRFLPEAVESILGQTLADFEFLIVDDACDDGSETYLSSISDSRVTVLRNKLNFGLTRSLNIGLDQAQGTFIARMDADDISEADRLAKQVDFLQRNPQIGLLGTARKLIDESGNVTATAQATTGSAFVLWKLLLGNAFAHPTVLLRRDVLEQNDLRYDTAFKTAQDYALWVRMLQFTGVENLTEPLVRYRLRDDGISRTRKADQLANHDLIAYRAIRTLLPEFNIKPFDVTELRGRFGGFSVRDLSMDVNDPHWQAVYSKLRDAFDAKYGVAPAPLAVAA